jgi:hypothetical protein
MGDSHWATDTQLFAGKITWIGKVNFLFVYRRHPPPPLPRKDAYVENMQPSVTFTLIRVERYNIPEYSTSWFSSYKGFINCEVSFWWPRLKMHIWWNSGRLGHCKYLLMAGPRCYSFCGIFICVEMAKFRFFCTVFWCSGTAFYWLLNPLFCKKLASLLIHNVFLNKYKFSYLQYYLKVVEIYVIFLLEAYCVHIIFLV